MANKDKPGRYEVTKAQIDVALGREQRSFPAIVVSYDGDTLMAEVQPAIRIRSKGGKQTTPKVVVIPVAWPSWSGYGFQGRLEQGDEVVVECQDRNWKAWLQTGGVVDYNAIGGRQSGYAVAKPVQVSAVRRPGRLGPGEAVRVGKLDGSSTVVLMDNGQVRVQSSDVRLGSDGGVPLALARHQDDVVAAAALFTWGAALTVATGVPNPWTVGVTPVGDVKASSTEVTST